MARPVYVIYNTRKGYVMYRDAATGENWYRVYTLLGLAKKKHKTATKAIQYRHRVHNRYTRLITTEEMLNDVELMKSLGVRKVKDV